MCFLGWVELYLRCGKFNVDDDVVMSGVWCLFVLSQRLLLCVSEVWVFCCCVCVGWVFGMVSKIGSIVSVIVVIMVLGMVIQLVCCISSLVRKGVSLLNSVVVMVIFSVRLFSCFLLGNCLVVVGVFIVFMLLVRYVSIIVLMVMNLLLLLLVIKLNIDSGSSMVVMFSLISIGLCFIWFDRVLVSGVIVMIVIVVIVERLSE